MKCKDCSNEIPAKFAHAMSVNICPYCGKEIMDTKLQKILNDLKSVMDDTKEYSDEVSDWLLSNYGLKKFDPKQEQAAPIVQGDAPQQTETKPHSMPRPIRRAEDGDDIEIENTATPVEQSIFARRAGVKPITSVKDIINKIQNGGAAPASAFQGEDDEYGNVNVEDHGPQLLPLNQGSKNELMSIFREDDAKISELEKLKRLHSQNANNSGRSVIRRSE